MEKTKQVAGSPSSSSSFTNDLFGPKEPSKSSFFGSVFGPHSTGLGRDSVHSGNQCGSAKYGNSDNGYQRSRGDVNRDKSPMYENESTVEPCHLSSSIYYGGQDVYSPATKTSGSQHTFKKNEEADDDQNGNNSNIASRGNWWQGSLYY